MAAHGLWDIDTGASCNLCYTIRRQRQGGPVASRLTVRPATDTVIAA